MAEWLRISVLGLVLALPGVAGCAGEPETGGVKMMEKARQLLAAAPADSDAAVILGPAIKEAEAAGAAEQEKILKAAVARAEEAQEFKISEEAPLPEGWPRPSLPGLIRIKTYPAARLAWVRSVGGENPQFMTLFRHIKERQIAMTAPVVMEYDASGPGEAELGQTAMAFLYRRTDQGEAGQFGRVAVETDAAVQVVSVGLKGPYWESRFAGKMKDLRAWLAAHPQWRATGRGRVLAYNSPFKLFWKKYSEVQLEVVAAGKE
jgi:hypothetical protein